MRLKGAQVEEDGGAGGVHELREVGHLGQEAVLHALLAQQLQQDEYDMIDEQTV